MSSFDDLNNFVEQPTENISLNTERDWIRSRLGSIISNVWKKDYANINMIKSMQSVSLQCRMKHIVYVLHVSFFRFLISF
jgi:hypothetical protein